MKVLLLNRWSHLETVGGAERVFFSMANALSERHEVTAFAMTQTGEDKPFFEIIPKLKFIHKNHCYEGTKNILLRITRAFHRSRVLRHRCDQKYADPVWAKVMRPVIEQEMPDVIVAYSLDLARVCLHTLSVACPVIIMFHQSPRVVMRNLTPEDRTTLEKVACVQVLMPSDVSFVEQRVKCRNIICIPNTVKISGFVSTLRNHKILHVGRFSKGDKRQHILIGAFHLLQKDFPDWKLEFWGGRVIRIRMSVNATNWCRNIIWKSACNSRALRMMSQKSCHRVPSLRSLAAKKGWGLRWWKQWKSAFLPLVFAPTMLLMKSFRMVLMAFCARTALNPFLRR